MFVAPGTWPDFAHKLSREAAESIARNWWKLLLSGLLLIVAGVLLFTIDWRVSSLAVFIGALFIAEGIMLAVTTGIDQRVRQANVISGLLSIVLGIVVIAWPGPGILAVAIFLGAWLIVLGTITMSGAFATRRLMKDWWLLLITGVLEVALGVLALIDPGSTLLALILVGGIFAVAVGVMQVVTSFQVKNLPHEVDQAFTRPAHNGATHPIKADAAKPKPLPAAS
jgi:uncharacterized membrane protein HdeD (DUF308 family)